MASKKSTNTKFEKELKDSQEQLLICLNDILSYASDELRNRLGTEELTIRDLVKILVETVKASGSIVTNLKTLKSLELGSEANDSIPSKPLVEMTDAELEAIIRRTVGE